MKKKILFNIAFLFSIIFIIFLIINHSILLSDSIQNYNYTKSVISQGFEVEHLLITYRNEIVKQSIILFFILVLCMFNLFMLIYINKNDITTISQSFSESRQKKAEEKKQQQIQELEEKLDQLKKDDK